VVFDPPALLAAGAFPFSVMNNGHTLEEVERAVARRSLCTGTQCVR
jgi:hypothetical protein